MKFASYEHPGGPLRLGVLADGLIHGCPPGTSLLSLLADPGWAAGQQALRDPDEVVSPATCGSPRSVRRRPRSATSSPSSSTSPRCPVACPTLTGMSCRSSTSATRLPSSARTTRS